MRLGKIASGAMAIWLAAALPGNAHHSVTGQFDPDQVMEWTGVISEIDWINPHIYVHLEVTDDAGNVTQWQLESAPPAMLQKGGLTSEKIRDGGSVVTIRGIRARDENLNRGFIYRITYPAGHYYQLGAGR